MGREIRRVRLDFDWPLNKVWSGFLNSRPGPRKCKACDGSGENRATHQIAEDFYDFAGTGRRWCDKITQDEVDALIAHNRLWDFWRRVGPNGWEDIAPRPVVTAEMVNAASRHGPTFRGFSAHDGCNRYILIETRARRLGVYGRCKKCRGEGATWRRPKDKRRYDRWQSSNPPKGGGWQVWETVSEGSPVSPVFAAQQSLVAWLVAHEGYSEKAAASFVVETGWVPSAMFVGGQMYRDIESAPVLAEAKGL